MTLTAGGITDSNGTVTSVSFILDSNNNGQYDADGYRARIDLFDRRRPGVDHGRHQRLDAGRIASLPGRRIARAFGVPALRRRLRCCRADDYGNNAATAAAIGVPSSTAGTIETGGDVDWFKFQAAAGKSYVFTVALGTLPDSVLYLYDTNGAKQLAFNDDYGSGGASQITWTAPTAGVYYLAVAGYGGSDVGTYTLSVAGQDAAPVLAAIGNQTLPYSQTTLADPLARLRCRRRQPDLFGSGDDDRPAGPEGIRARPATRPAHLRERELLHQRPRGRREVPAGQRQRAVFHPAQRRALPLGRQHRQEHARRYVESGVLCQSRPAAQRPNALAHVDQQRQRRCDRLRQHADGHAAGGLHRRALRSGPRQRRLEIRLGRLHRRRSLRPESV